MKITFSALAGRFLFLLVAGTAAVLPTACKKEAATATADYSSIDEAIIKKYLSDNAITTAQRQASGLYYQPIATDAAATRAVAGKTVSVLYAGRFMDGRVFDSSLDRSKPFSFVLGRGQVIAGWDEGIALMHKGDKGVLLIPSALAYGSSGAGSTIPPNTVLRFEVEVVDVK